MLVLFSGLSFVVNEADDMRRKYKFVRIAKFGRNVAFDSFLCGVGDLVFLVRWDSFYRCIDGDPVNLSPNFKFSWGDVWGWEEKRSVLTKRGSWSEVMMVPKNGVLLIREDMDSVMRMWSIIEKPWNPWKMSSWLLI